MEFWAKTLAKEIITKKGKKITISTGITPSGHIHIGNMREVITADFVRRELEKLGAKVRFIYIADDYDRLRKLYPFLPKNFEKYIGWPLSNIPDPEGDKDYSYATRFLNPFLTVLQEIGIDAEVLSTTKLYKDGFFTHNIRKSLEQKDKIKEILSKISGRKMPEDWFPYNPLCKKCGKIDEAKIIELDLDNNRVKYCCTCGDSDWSDFSKGEGKLSWRVEWPSKWSSIPVDVEPYGKEHATVGGSYDTGKAICEEIFESEAPFGIGYDLLYLKGFKGKMSSSLGNVISAQDFVEVVPPEILRYMFAKYSYNKSFYFDPEMGFLQLAQEYADLEDKVNTNQANDYEKDLFDACQIKRSGRVIAPVPFKHLINAVQTSQGNFEEIKRLLSRTGHNKAIQNEDLLKEQIKKVNIWLQKYAPENVKFSIKNEVPNINLSDEQKKLLTAIADALSQKEYSGEELHNLIYETGKNIGLKPKDTFSPIYESLIGKNSGPKAGWFIVLLDKDFVINRFREVSK